jgi:hypothetical protein
MARENLREIGIAFGGENRERMAKRPDHNPGDPEPQARPKAAAMVPFRIAIDRGAPAKRIGSVKERCSGTSKPSLI